MNKISENISQSEISEASSINEDENDEEEDLLFAEDDDGDEWDFSEEMDNMEENSGVETLSEDSFEATPNLDVPMRKYPFRLQRNEAGNILTVHNTNVEQQLRVRISIGCFNDSSNKLVIIDKRGNTYVFDFVSKRYWRLSIRLPQATLVSPSPVYHSGIIVGDARGTFHAVDLDSSAVTHNIEVRSTAIDEITWGNRLKSSSANNTIVRLGTDAVLLNFRTMQVTHALEFDNARHTLKFAGFIPNSDQFFTCFTNDAVHIWSSHSLQMVYITHPIKTRDQKLRIMRSDSSVTEISLRGDEEDDINSEDELAFDCQDEHFADGKLLSYSFTPNGNKISFSTSDGYILLHNSASFDLEKIIRLKDFQLKQLKFLPQPKYRIVFGITARGQTILLDLENTDLKMIVQRSNSVGLSVSRDGKLLLTLSKSGEVDVWSTCRLYNALQAKTHCITQLRTVLKKPKLPGHVSCPINQELRQLLKRDRLKAMLSEYGCYPEKYRFVIWSSLLELPCNAKEYQALLKLGQPAIVRQHVRSLRVKSDAQRRAVIRVWSCLAHWCKVFGYAKFMPHLVYPFVKHLVKNGLVVFELMVTLLLNHWQLWFEFHPLPPENYLAMCENVLQSNDEPLCKFYKAMNVESKDYAWSMVTNAFAEVLEEQQWLTLWDNIITEPPHFIIFIIVAYNMLQRELIVRLPDKEAVLRLFHEQNPIDVGKLVFQAHKIMKKCPAQAHPKRFLPPLTPIPKGVYPKFLKYPSDWIAEQEVQTMTLHQQNQEIDARIRHLEMEELKMVERLENGLKQEEHVRRIKKMEKLYQETIQREEERINCNRKLLLTYQLEVRQRKSEVMSQVQETEQRRKILEMEKEIDSLMHTIERERRRHNQELQFAEDEIRNQEMELLAQRYYMDTGGAPLAQKYYDNIQRMCRERDKLQKGLRKMTMQQLNKPTSRRPKTPLTVIERSIMEIQREFSDILGSEESKSNGN